MTNGEHLQHAVTPAAEKQSAKSPKAAADRKPADRPNGRSAKSARDETSAR